MSMQHAYDQERIYTSRYGCSHYGDEGTASSGCGGWILGSFDTWHKCGIHYDDQPHPEEEDCVEDYAESQ